MTQPAETTDEVGAEVVVVEDPTGALVVGDRSAVEAFVAEWEARGTEIVTRTELTGTARQRAVTTAADLATIGTGTAHYLRTKNVIGAGRGETVVLRKWVQSSNGRIVENSPLDPALLTRTNPAAALAAIAVRSALADMTREITAAVERVEGKADDLLRLANADRAGDVSGQYRMLARMVRALDEGTQLSATDWSTVASMGPGLEVTVERLRGYLLRLVRGLPAGLPADERADRLGRAADEGRLGEMLRMLIVAEQSLYLWQRLRVERVLSAEPEHLDHAVISAHATLAEHLTADLQLVTELREVLAGYGSLTAFEFHRKLSGRRLHRHVSALQAELDYFVDARRIQISAWDPLPMPTARDAITAAGRAVAETGRTTKALGDRALDAAVSGVGRAGGAIQQRAERWREDRGATEKSESSPDEAR